MNSRQRRGVILLLLSVFLAFVAFAAVLSVISDAKSKVGPEVSAYQVKDDIAPYTQLSEAQFEKVKMPKRWLSENAITDLSEINGKIAVTNLRHGSLLQSDMIVKRPALEAGEQEIAIMIDAVTGVAGKIKPGAKVNIFATFAGDDRNSAPQSKIIVSNAKVIDVGQLTPLEGKGDNSNSRSTMSQAVPITFALNTMDAQRVAYAESFAQHVRLALIAPGSDASLRNGERTYELSKDK
ncbi:Flp pilus assembly protein CpaB [Streptomyces colonosanans]|uniref:Flp pilus assembly protein CpaB n=1 Tax=Streptomyces colonosanans TaxID=1428652 RepID=A0A1S2NV23_9ACTN|nr:Flp pilus assembly protein CpaB [Streptomyces colonosanans]OIJ85409.1 Flp pilus assembly protein CpaB [Streptomyces colonosanans]